MVSNWVCLKIGYIMVYDIAPMATTETDDKPVGFGVPYSQTKPIEDRDAMKMESKSNSRTDKQQLGVSL